MKMMKQILWERFQQMLRKQTHFALTDQTPEQALEIGYRMGLREGYEEGLVDGLSLNLDTKAQVDTKTSPFDLITYN